MNLSFKRVYEDDWKTTVGIEKLVDDGRTFKAFTKENEAREYLRKSVVYVVMLDDKAIGTVSYEPKSEDHAYIDSLTIIPEYQGKGYGSQAIEWLLKQLKDYSLIDLVTHPNNSKSLRVYLKYGFIIDSWIDNYFGDGEPRLRLILKRN